MLRVDTVFQGLPGMPGYNSLYFSGTGATQAAAAAEKVHDLWSDLAQSLNAELDISISDEVVDLNIQTGAVVDIFNHITAPISGFLAGDLLPLSTQLVIGFTTAGIVNNRRVRGRIFIPGCVEETNDSLGTPSPTFRGDMAALVNSDLLAGDPSLVVWSRPVQGGRPGSQHLVTGCSAKSQWGTLTSRRP